jgi:hypothetical protein
VEYLSYLGSNTTNDARRARDIATGIAISRAAFSKKKALFASKLD